MKQALKSICQFWDTESKMSDNLLTQTISLQRDMFDLTASPLILMEQHRNSNILQAIFTSNDLFHFKL